MIKATWNTPDGLRCLMTGLGIKVSPVDSNHVLLNERVEVDPGSGLFRYRIFNGWNRYEHPDLLRILATGKPIPHGSTERLGLIALKARIMGLRLVLGYSRRRPESMPLSAARLRQEYGILVEEYYSKLKHDILPATRPQMRLARFICRTLRMPPPGELTKTEASTFIDSNLEFHLAVRDRRASPIVQGMSRNRGAVKKVRVASPKPKPSATVKKGRKLRPMLESSSVTAQPDRQLDYSKLKRFDATQDQLAMAGVASVDDLVERINALRLTSGHRPMPQGDFPSNKAAFLKLVSQYRLFVSDAR